MTLQSAELKYNPTCTSISVRGNGISPWYINGLLPRNCPEMLPEFITL